MSVYDVGFDLHLHRTGPALQGGDIAVPSIGIASMGSGASSAPSMVLGERIPATEFGEILFHAKQSFTSTVDGWRQGLDTDGIYKWVIGDGTSSADWAVTTANTLTVTGTIVAAAGFIGGWTITAGYLYDLTSGTPTAVPNNGVVMDSGNAALIFYEGTAERVRLGYLSAAVYGLRVFATDGTTVIWESSDTRQFLAGFSFDSTQITVAAGGNTTTISSGATSFLSGPTGAPTFSVTQAGAVTATSGAIGGWNLSATVLRSGATDAASNVLIDSANSLFRLGPTTGDFITLDGANQRMRSSTYATGVSGFTVEPNLVEAQNIIARGTLSGSVNRYDVISATGGRNVIANADALSTAMTALDASTLTTRGNVTFAVNDILVIRAQSSGGIQEEYLRVTGIGAAPTYTVTRDLLGTYAADTNPAWAAGTAVVQHGESDGAAAFSGGWLDLVGEASAGNFPRISVFQRTGVGATAFTERVRMGNLNGYLGYVADTYGVGMGSSVAGEANITIDPTNGLRMRQGTTNLITLDNAGTASLLNLTVSGSLNVLTSGNIRSGQTAYNTGTGYFLEYNAGTPRISIGNPATNFLTWDGTNLTISGGLIMNAGTGVVTINQSATTGSSLSVIRNLAAASTDSSVVYFQNDNAGDDQTTLTLQHDPPTQATLFTALTTTAAAFEFIASSLTTGYVGQFYSNSADASVRAVLRVVNDNTLATGAIALLVAQDAAGIGLQVSQDGNARALFLSASGPTTADTLDVVASSLTTGSCARFYSNSADVSVRTLTVIRNDNTLATGARLLDLFQDSTNEAIHIETLGTTTAALNIEASSLTSGTVGYFYSNSASVTARSLIQIVNDNALATGAICLAMQQDGGNAHFRLTGDPANSSPTDGDVWYNGTNVLMYDGTDTYGLTTRTATGTNTRGQASGAGSQAITGAGFRPRAVAIYAVATVAIGDVCTSNGFASSTGSESAVARYFETGTTVVATAATFIYLIRNTGAVAAQADLTSFDADGFTINWTTITDANLDSDITFQWIAYN